MKKKMVMTEGLMLLFVGRGRGWDVQISEKGPSFGNSRVSKYGL